MEYINTIETKHRESESESVDPGQFIDEGGREGGRKVCQ